MAVKSEPNDGVFSSSITNPQYTGNANPQTKPILNADGYLDFGPDDKDNPKNWSKKRRWYITLVVILMVMNATFASSTPTGAFDGISRDLHVSVEAAGLVTTLFLLGYCAGPLFWAPISEFYG